VTEARDRYRAAVHEAAHAVAALFLDRPVTEVAVVGSGGHCALGPPRDWSVSDALGEAIIALAGDLAVGRVPVASAVEVPAVVVAQDVVEAEADAIWRSPWADVPGDDRSVAELLVAGVAVNDEEAGLLLRVAEIRAGAMLDDLEFRAVVLHVADALHREGRLDGDAVRVEAERAVWRLRFAAEDQEDRDGPQAA
jgi:hypothetical protein